MFKSGLSRVHYHGKQSDIEEARMPRTRPAINRPHIAIFSVSPHSHLAYAPPQYHFACHGSERDLNQTWTCKYIRDLIYVSYVCQVRMRRNRKNSYMRSIYCGSCLSSVWLRRTWQRKLMKRFRTTHSLRSICLQRTWRHVRCKQILRSECVVRNRFINFRCHVRRNHTEDKQDPQ